jgi:hypothetical protein
MARKAGKKKKVRSSQIPMFEGRGKRYHVNRLKWLLNLLNTDILSLPPGGFLKLFYEFLAFFYENYVEEEVLKRVCVDTPEDREQLKMARGILARIISELLRKLFWRQIIQTDPERRKTDPYIASILDEIETTKVWDGYGKVSFAYHLHGERIVLVPEIRIYEYDNLQTDDEIRIVREFSELEDIGEDFKKIHQKVREAVVQKLKEQGARKEVIEKQLEEPYDRDRVPYGKFSKFCDPTMSATLGFQLYNLIEKFPLSSIYSCPECSKYFVATRKKQSKYCKRCINKKHVKNWRDKNRPVYNAYQRNLQKGVKTSVEEIRDDLAREKGKEGNNDS